MGLKVKEMKMTEFKCHCPTCGAEFKEVDGDEVMRIVSRVVDEHTKKLIESELSDCKRQFANKITWLEERIMALEAKTSFMKPYDYMPRIGETIITMENKN
jgi:uncharacterized protein with PIN domain